MPSSVVFHEESEKKYKKIQKNNILPANLALNVDILKKLAFLYIQGLFWSFYGYHWP
jgi:hypothetical protein